MPASHEEILAQADEVKKIQSLSLPSPQPRLHFLRNRLDALNLKAPRGPVVCEIAYLEGGPGVPWSGFPRDLCYHHSNRLQCEAPSTNSPSIMDSSLQYPNGSSRRSRDPSASRNVQNGVILRETSDLTAAFLSPHQIGCGVPAACQLAVTVVQSWAADAVANARALPDPLQPEFDPVEACRRQAEALEFVISSVDESNAYGALFRSKGLLATRRVAIHLAGILASQWQTTHTTVWQRVGHGWRKSESARGGWQGSQLMQIVYAIEQEFNLRLPFGAANLSLSQRGAARIAILDDQYLAAPASALAECWEEFKVQLGTSGHTVQDAKSRAFAPAWAEVEDVGALPVALQGVFALLPRSIKGIPMLGSAAISGGNPIDSVLLVKADAISLSAPTKRCERALELAEAITEFAFSVTLTLGR